MSTTFTVTTSEAIEQEFLCVNQLSDVLKQVVCASLWARPEIYESINYTECEDQIDAICMFLDRFELAKEVKSEPCKIVRDEESGNNRLAEPDEADVAEEGLLLHWEATPALMKMIQECTGLKWMVSGSSVSQ
jgi:hypothetical protein